MIGWFVFGICIWCLLSCIVCIMAGRTIRIGMSELQPNFADNLQNDNKP